MHLDRHIADELVDPSPTFPEMLLYALIRLIHQQEVVELSDLVHDDFLYQVRVDDVAFDLVL